MRKFLIAVSAVAALAASFVFAPADKPAVTPENLRAGVKFSQNPAVQRFVSGLPRFKITGAGATEDHSKDVVKLWEQCQRVTGGHLRNYPQETGDCVGFGLRRAIETLQCVQIDRGALQKFREVHPSYPYSVARVLIDKGWPGCNEAGADPAAAIAGAKEYGILFADEAGAPKYSGGLSDSWGCRGPPAAMVALASKYKLKTAAQVTTWQEARDSICNGYPCTVAGVFNPSSIKQQYGRWVADWAVFPKGGGHQMCIDGFDGAGPVPLFHMTNSWGDTAHPKPADGSPPGGFWVTASTVDRLCKNGQVFTVSLFDGFPAQDLDFTVIRRPIKAAMGVEMNFTVFASLCAIALAVLACSSVRGRPPFAWIVLVAIGCGTASAGEPLNFATVGASGPNLDFRTICPAAAKLQIAESGRLNFQCVGSEAAKPRKSYTAPKLTPESTLPVRRRMYVYWAIWCGPCAKERPAIEQFCRDNGLTLGVYTGPPAANDPDVLLVDVDKFPSKAGITTIPAIRVVEAAEVGRIVGLATVNQIVELWQRGRDSAAK